jgi:hypothetical protein
MSNKDRTHQVQVTEKLKHLLAEVGGGSKVCKVLKVIKDPDAIVFVDGVCQLYRSYLEDEAHKSKPRIVRAVEIIKEYWNIDINRRTFADHVRGKCPCQKK